VSAGKGALVSVIVSVVTWIIFIIIGAVAVNNINNAVNDYNDTTTYSSSSDTTTYSSSSLDTTESSSSSNGASFLIDYPKSESGIISFTDSKGHSEDINIWIGRWIKGSDSNLNQFWRQYMVGTGDSMANALKNFSIADPSSCIVVFGSISNANGNIDNSASSFNKGKGLELQFNLTAGSGSPVFISKAQNPSSNYSVLSEINFPSGFKETDEANGDLCLKVSTAKTNIKWQGQSFVIVIPNVITPNNPDGILNLQDSNGNPITVKPRDLKLTMANNPAFKITGNTPSVLIGQNW
jgi:hypothetical protein